MLKQNNFDVLRQLNFPIPDDNGRILCGLKLKFGRYTYLYEIWTSDSYRILLIHKTIKTSLILESGLVVQICLIMI